MKKRLFTAAAAALLISGTVAEPSTVTATGNDGGASPNASIDNGSALVQLTGAPLSTSSKTRPAPGKKIDFGSTQTRSYRAELASRRNDFKQWLRANAPKAKVTGEFDISLNAVAVQLNGTSLATLRTSPLVASVEYQGLYHPLAADPDPDLSLINALDAWDKAGGAADAGEGVKVAIVDTGIDITHPCFSDAGYPAQTQLGVQQFTNNKVIVAKVFSNKTVAGGYTPEAIQDHGTHVAGTVACNYETPATVDGVPIPYDISGVAPKALLGNYNVFPADVENARSEDILNALEAAYTDGFDVANMSLGGGSHGVQDLLTIAVDDLDMANMVVAVAAGNSGPGYDTVESPGMAARALSAGASSVNHFVGATLTVGENPIPIASGDFATVQSNLTAPLGVVTDSSKKLVTACTALAAESLSGKIGVISRGGCTFSIKIRNAQAAGAVGVIVVNNVAGDPTAMASDGTANQPTVPAYMASLADSGTLVANTGKPATISKLLSYQLTDNANIMAGFSSQGPTDVTRRVKPDVVAPGVNVLSSIPHSFCAAPPCFAFFSGTSMATPHLAGSAAVVIQQHPDWSAAEVRSAIVNTADNTVLKSYLDASSVSDPNIIGAGLENLFNAVRASAAIDPVSTSFGAIPAGSGQTRTATITVTNLSVAQASFAFSVDAKSTFTVSPPTATLGAGESVTITVTATTGKRQAAGKYSTSLKISKGGAEVAHSVLFYESR